MSTPTAVTMTPARRKELRDDGGAGLTCGEVLGLLDLCDTLTSQLDTAREDLREVSESFTAWRETHDREASDDDESADVARMVAEEEVREALATLDRVRKHLTLALLETLKDGT